MGGVNFATQKKYFPKLDLFILMSALSYGFVMLLFKINRKSLQSSLRSSMTFLYEDSENWEDWKDFVPFHIPKNIK